MKIGTLIILGFALLELLFVGVSAFSYRRLVKGKNLLEHSLKTSESMLVARRAEKDFILRHDQEGAKINMSIKRIKRL